MILHISLDRPVELGPGNRYEFKIKEQVVVPDGFAVLIHSLPDVISRFPLQVVGYVDGGLRLIVTNQHAWQSRVVADGEAVAGAYLIEVKEPILKEEK